MSEAATPPAIAIASELLAVLATEREAIRKLDASAVCRAAAEKERLATALVALRPEELAPARESIATLRRELRHNGVLLAHARSCVKESLEIVKSRGLVRKRV